MRSLTIKFLEAQNGDCFLLSFDDNEGVPRNILIDGGRENSYFDKSTNEYGELHSELELIRNSKQKIDLLILTHIDNDHICGLLKWFELDEDAHKLIKNIWFNSGKLIAESLKELENPDLKLGLKIFYDKNTGVNEAIDFEDYLLKYKIWRRELILKGYSFDDFGIKIKALSPNQKQIRKLLEEYRNVTGDPVYTVGKESDWSKTLKDFILEESQATYRFKQDTSVKNGSSITFILTINKMNFLFLGDSHPKGIVDSLKELGYSEDKQLEVELFKVAHHGSKSNTNNELIKLVKTKNYFFSTNSASDFHPNKRTLARIINFNEESVFHFNYKNVKENIMMPQDHNDYPNMKIRFTKYLDF